MWSLVKNTLLIYQPSNYDIKINDDLIDNIVKNYEEQCNKGLQKTVLPNEIPNAISLPPEPPVVVFDVGDYEEIDPNIGETLKKRCIHAFDFDSTLVCQKSGHKYPIDENDWQFQFENVREKLQHEYEENNNTLVIFSNQSGVEKNKINIETVKGRFENFLKNIDVPVWCFIALGNDHFRKPCRFMWDIMIGLLENHIQDYSHNIYNESTKIAWDLSNCLYVGDAAGRTKECFANSDSKRGKDFACSDRKFAFNIGIKFKTPEEYFLEEEVCSKTMWKWDGFDPQNYYDRHKTERITQLDQILDKSTGDASGELQEIVVLVGPPSCGKSTFCAEYFPNHVRINMDTLKTKAKCLKSAKEALQKGKSIIVDNTNSTLETRNEYINMNNVMSNPFDKKKHVTKCIHFNVPKDLALHLNNLRVKMTHNQTKKLPEVSYNVYYKNLVEPTVEEGFDYVFDVPFVVNFKDNLHKKRFMERT